jgi:ABC-2 type transport system permease protein
MIMAPGASKGKDQMTKEDSKFDVVEKKQRKFKFEIDLNPVLLKELRSRTRSRSVFFVLSFYTVLMGLTIGLLYFSLTVENHISFMGVLVTRQLLGKIIYWSTAGLDILAVLVITPWILAGSISTERENLTFDLLAVT